MGITQKSLTGYFETEYSSDWPGLVTSRPSSRIPPGACISCNAQVIRGHLQAQPFLVQVTGSDGLTVIPPVFEAGENVCAMANLQPPGLQQGFTVLITNFSVYLDYIVPTNVASTKTFTKIFNFPSQYPRYARIGTCVIGNVLYFSSASQLGVYAVRPTFSVVSAQITNPGGYFDAGTPTGFLSGGGGTGPLVGSTGVNVDGNLISVNLTPSVSSGYISAPLISFEGGTTTGPQGGKTFASAVGVLSKYPSNYVVQEVSAFTGVASIEVTVPGSGFTNPQVLFIGGGGTGAAAQAIVDGSGGIAGITVTSPGQNYTSPPAVLVVDPVGGTGATAIATLFQGKPFVGGDFMTSMSGRLILANIIGGDGNNTFTIKDVIVTNGGSGYTSATVDFVGGGGAGAAATVALSGGSVASITITNPGSGYTSVPAINILGDGSGATALVEVGSIPTASSTTTKYADRVQWSAPNSYGNFDPNYTIAPGGFNIISEARGLLTSANVIESVCFLGHNGGITEMTPNTSSAQTPFSFYPLWSAEEGVLVRYGSMAQYGSTLAFLSEDTAYTMTPNGLSEIGANIANLLQNASLWRNGLFPLQGLYGSIVLFEGQKHYLIAFSSDDPNLATRTARGTFVYDFNMSENSWHTWNYSLFTATCAIYQSFDTASYVNLGNNISRDSWIMAPWTSTLSNFETPGFYELTSLARYINLGMPTPIVAPLFNYNFRTETPSIARMQEERRIAVEYENQPALVSLAPPPNLAFFYTGQQDPTDQTGTISQQQSSTRAINYIPANTFNSVPNQILTTQADFSTFTGVCTELALAMTGTNTLVSLVRITQVADLPKAQLP